MEGPFNEYPGYNSHDASAKALFRKHSRLR